MIEPPRPRAGGGQVVRPQLALELALNAYAALAAVVLIRFLLLALRVDGRLWIGTTVYRLTNPMVKPLTLLPGAGLHLVGAAALPDLTLVALVPLVPLGAIAVAYRIPVRR